MDFDKILWGDKIIEALFEDPDLNMAFDRSLEAVARAQGGNKILLPGLDAGGSFSRSDNKKVGTGLPLTPADTSESDNYLEIFEYTYGPIVIRNLKTVQMHLPLLQKYTNQIAKAAKEHMFTAACTHVINNVHADNKLPWTGTAGSKFVYDDLGAMAKAMNDAKVLRDNRFCAIGTDAEDSLGTDDYLKNWMAVNQQAIKDGRLPGLKGFNFLPSTLIPASKADGTIDAVLANNTKKNAVAWRKDHMNLVVQTEMEIVGSEDAKYLGFVPAFTIRYGLLLDNNKAGVQSTQQ